jgi:hypothetical protein
MYFVLCSFVYNCIPRVILLLVLIYAFLCLTMHTGAWYIQCRMVRQLVNSELQRMWKEVMLAYLSYYPGIGVVRLRTTPKNSVGIIDTWQEILIGFLLSTSVKCYHFSKLPRWNLLMWKNIPTKEILQNMWLQCTEKCELPNFQLWKLKVLIRINR